MYSAAALELYGELLKQAQASVAGEFEKNAGLRDGLLRLLGRGGRLADVIGSDVAAHVPQSAAGRAAVAAKPPLPFLGNLADRAPAAGTLAAERGRTAVGAGRLGLGTKAMLAGGVGASGLGAYALGQHNQAVENKTQRNLAFGAGAAAGLAAPHILRTVSGQLNNLAMSPYGGGM